MVTQSTLDTKKIRHFFRHWFQKIQNNLGNEPRRRSADEKIEQVVYHPEEPVITRRVEGDIVISLRLRPDQVADFQDRLEELCNEFLNV